MCILDADKGTNAEIVYSISDNKGNNQFTVNSVNGELSLVSSLDRETKENMEIVVTATDKGMQQIISLADPLPLLNEL